MATYRIYLFDGAGRLTTASDAECSSDDAAIAWASTTLHDDACAEVWQDVRRIGRITGGQLLLDPVADHWSVLAGKWLAEQDEDMAKQPTERTCV